MQGKGRHVLDAVPEVQGPERDPLACGLQEQVRLRMSDSSLASLAVLVQSMTSATYGRKDFVIGCFRACTMCRVIIEVRRAL